MQTDTMFQYGLNIRVAPKGFDLSSVDPKAESSAELDVQTHGGAVDVELMEISEIQTSHEGTRLRRVNSTSQPEAGVSPKATPFIHKVWRADSTTDPFAALHQQGAEDIVWLEFEKGQALDKPVDISLNPEFGPVFTTFFVHMLPGSSGTIRLSLTGTERDEEKTKPPINSSAIYTSLDIRVVGERGSQLTFVLSETLAADQVVVVRQQAHLKETARVDWLGLSLGSHYAQIDVVSDLDGAGAESEMTYLYLATGLQRKTLSTQSIHSGRSTLSNIITRGVVSDKAKALSTGLVKINPDAAGSNGYETQDALLLSPKAEADAIPNLEIHNHDVKCSHGSTVGQIDAEALHYLQSRGLSLVQARRLIVEGYFTPLLEKIGDQAVGERVQNAITQGIK